MGCPRSYTILYALLFGVSHVSFADAQDMRVGAKTGRHFYFTATGNDQDTGRALDHAWRHLSRLNTVELEPGDVVELGGGTTFEGSIRLRFSEEGTDRRPITIASDARDPATILSTNGPAVEASSGGLSIHDLILKGRAKAAQKGDSGILFQASDSGKQARHIRIDHVEIADFGEHGISFQGAPHKPLGFSDVRIQNVFVHGVFGTGILSQDETSHPHIGYSHHDFFVSDCKVANNPSGSGIILAGLDHGLVEYCQARNNFGATGGLGMWAWAAHDVTFRYCIASGTRSQGGDGGGFDLDGGCVNCKVEHCLSFDNDGPGYMHCDYPEAPPTTDNFIDDNVTIDDGRKLHKGEPFGVGFVTWGSGLDRCKVMRNLVICTRKAENHDHMGAFFVAYIPSPDKKDTNHVKGCSFENNAAILTASGIDFVRDELPEKLPDHVQWYGNAFLGPEEHPFQVDKQRFATFSEWERALGVQDQRNRRETTLAVGPRVLGSYRGLEPRDLPKWLKSIM